MLKKRNDIIGKILLVIGLLFIALGVYTGESQLVWQKAIRICLECIGIG